MIFFSDFLSFSLMSFFYSRIPSRIPHDIQPNRLLRLILAKAVFQAFFVFDVLDSFEEYWLGIL